MLLLSPKKSIFVLMGGISRSADDELRGLNFETEVGRAILPHLRISIPSWNEKPEWAGAGPRGPIP